MDALEVTTNATCRFVWQSMQLQFAIQAYKTVAHLLLLDLVYPIIKILDVDKDPELAGFTLEDSGRAYLKMLVISNLLLADRNVQGAPAYDHKGNQTSPRLHCNATYLYTRILLLVRLRV